MMHGPNKLKIHMSDFVFLLQYVLGLGYGLLVYDAV